jgi:Ni/Co efflux regulator RcnB
MKLRTLSPLLLAFSMSLPVFAIAQEHDDQHEGHGEKDRHAPPAAKPVEHSHALPQRDQQRDAHSGDRGAGPDHAFRRGGRLPDQYRNNQYVVDDWRGHHLSAPPRGYHWVQTGPDYVLAAIATGVIADILLSQ